MASTLAACNAPLSSVQSSFRVGDRKLNNNAGPQGPATSSIGSRGDSVLVRAQGQGSIAQHAKRRDLLAAGVAAQILLGRNALAVPVTPPNLTQCQPASPASTSTVTVQCCLPSSAAPPKPYVPSPGKLLKVRRRANAVDSAYAEKYNEAYRRMRALPDSDPRSFKQQADVHCAFCNGAYPSAQNSSIQLQIHNSYLFFPWHRYYLYFHERILGSLINDPTFALPYWNWDDQRYGGNRMPAIFDQKDKYPALYDVNRNPTHGPSVLAALTLGNASTITDEEILANNERAMYTSLINPNTQSLFLGSTPSLETSSSTASQGTLEAGPHTAIHVFVGNPANAFREDMGNFYSAGRDPIFYCHHANVDRCWYIWDTIPGKRKDLYADPDFLNSSFVFYNERSELVQVSVKDCLNTQAQLGITYEPSPGSDLYREKAPKPLGGARGLVPKDKGKLRVFGSKASGQAVQKLGAAEALSAVVQRPTGKAAFAKSKGIDESLVEEVLVLEDVIVPSTATSSLAIFINLPDANTSTKIDCAEYVGSVSNLPHVGMRDMKQHITTIKLSISDNIKNLGIEDQTSLAVSVVLKVLDSSAADKVSIGGFKIEYV